jgi:hypothetical protein
MGPVILMNDGKAKVIGGQHLLVGHESMTCWTLNLLYVFLVVLWNGYCLVLYGKKKENGKSTGYRLVVPWQVWRYDVAHVTLPYFCNEYYF